MIDPKDGDIVDFHLVQDGIYGNERKGVTVLGTLSYDGACVIDPNLANKHSALYPYFKEKVSNVDNPSLYRYLIYRETNGAAPQAVGIPWIMDSTYRSVSGRVMVINVMNWSEDYRANFQTFLKNMGVTYTMNEKDK